MFQNMILQSFLVDLEKKIIEKDFMQLSKRLGESRFPNRKRVKHRPVFRQEPRNYFKRN